MNKTIKDSLDAAGIGVSEKWLTSAEVYQLMGLSPRSQTERRAAFSGRRTDLSKACALPYVTYGSAVYMRIEDVEKSMCAIPPAATRINRPDRWYKYAARKGLSYTIRKSELKKQKKAQKSGQKKIKQLPLQLSRTFDENIVFSDLHNAKPVTTLNGHRSQHENSSYRAGIMEGRRQMIKLFELVKEMPELQDMISSLVEKQL